jgi:AraC-like DNA-binding protein
MSKFTSTDENSISPTSESAKLITYDSVEDVLQNINEENDFPFIQTFKSHFNKFQLSSSNTSITFDFAPSFGDGTGQFFSPYPGVSILMLSGTLFVEQNLCSLSQDIGHCENFISIRLIDEGQSIMDTGNVQKLLVPGDMFVYNYLPGKNIKITPSANKLHRYTSIYFNKNSLSNLSSSLNIPMPEILEKLINARTNETHLFLLERSKMLTQLIDSFWICGHQGIYKSLSMRLKVTEILYLLGGTEIDSINYHTESINFREATAIAEVREALDKEYRSPPSIDLLAAKSGINRNQLCIMFKQIYSITIAQYCKVKRLELAYSLLIKTNNSILNISKEAGYKHVSNFTRAFTSHFKINPNKLKHHINR